MRPSGSAASQPRTPNPSRLYPLPRTLYPVPVNGPARELDLHLDPAQFSLLRRASRAANELGFDLYLVGGTIRDVLIGRTPTDLDVVIAGGDERSPSALAGRLEAEVLSESQFGTARLRVDDVEFDVAMSRTEVYEHPGALPKVSPAPVEDDLARRDFTIDAVAVSLAEPKWGHVLDPHDGRHDIDHKLIRVLHDNSFVDDATRILRAVRYAGRLGFELESETRKLLDRDLRRLDTISGDRVRHELERIFTEPRGVEVLRLADELGVLAAIHPALTFDSALAEKTRAASGSPTRLRLLALAVFGARDDYDELVSRLNMNTTWTKVVRDVGAVRSAIPRLGEPSVRRAEVWDLLRELAVESIEACATATDDPNARRNLELYLTELRHVKPILNGDDIMALGVPEGPQVGELLDALLKARLEGLIATREDEETMVRHTLEGRHRA